MIVESPRRRRAGFTLLPDHICVSNYYYYYYYYDI